MPATTDWLDGLNKELGAYDTEYYLHQFRTECQRQRMTTLAFPKRDYIVQVARFDPSKGIPDVLASYAEFRRTSKFCRGKPAEETPQLVVCGHYSVDDPDGVMVLDQTLELLDTKYSDVKGSVVVMRLGPTDQLLNVLLSNAKVALQLSTREGFEVKVSEALHKGVPVIASNAGGIPLQVQHEKSGFVVETGDYKAVSGFLDRFFSDKDEYVRISEYAAAHVSDEVSTVGNAVCWMYLADQLSSGQGMAPNGRFVWVSRYGLLHTQVPWLTYRFAGYGTEAGRRAGGPRREYAATEPHDIGLCRLACDSGRCTGGYMNSDIAFN